ncbi:hypothetical protein [Pseudomonas asiatica]|uniref:hypothetical protein n=1 Tax=Pseudomonas asiatica TaxID=2219225 RepID=UPI003BA2DF00|nr:hypothetical protein [Pseudomonas shirazica]
MDVPIGLRKPDKCGYYGKHLIFHPSRKTGRQEVCNSVLESDYCILLEWDKNVVNYASQPGALEVKINGKKRRYHPDFRVETREALYFTEVKHDFETINPKRRELLLAAQQVFADLGYSLVFADTSSIRQGVKLKNIKFLYFHSFNVCDEEKTACQRWLQSIKYPVPLRALIYTNSIVRERAVYQALFDGVLLTDLASQLTLDSLLNFNSEK